MSSTSLKKCFSRESKASSVWLSPKGHGSCSGLWRCPWKLCSNCSRIFLCVWENRSCINSCLCTVKLLTNKGVYIAMKRHDSWRKLEKKLQRNKLLGNWMVTGCFAVNQLNWIIAHRIPITHLGNSSGPRRSFGGPKSDPKKSLIFTMYTMDLQIRGSFASSEEVLHVRHHPRFHVPLASAILAAYHPKWRPNQAPRQFQSLRKHHPDRHVNIPNQASSLATWILNSYSPFLWHCNPWLFAFPHSFLGIRNGHEFHFYESQRGGNSRDREQNQVCPESHGGRLATADNLFYSRFLGETLKKRRRTFEQWLGTYVQHRPDRPRCHIHCFNSVDKLLLTRPVWVCCRISVVLRVDISNEERAPF